MNADYFGTIQLMEEPTGIEKESSLPPANFQIYPNPGDGILNVQINSSAIDNGVTIRLFNILGQKVFEIDPARDQALVFDRINLNHLPNGIYLLMAELKHQIIKQKITIIKN